MRKKSIKSKPVLLKKSIRKLIVKTDRLSPDYIVPFSEKPTVNLSEKDGMDAHALFSIFTADVIKRDIIFFK